MNLLFKIFLIAYAIRFVWDISTRKYVNYFKCIYLLGGKGAGKTTTEVKLINRYLRRGYHVYSDMPSLQIPGVRYYNWRDLGEFVPESDSLLILSEIGTKFDKRHFKNFTDELRDFFVYQRKYRCVVICDSQAYDPDSKIRDRMDELYCLKCVGRVWSIGRRYVFRPRVLQATEEHGATVVNDLHLCGLTSSMITFIPAWTDLFDTREVDVERPKLKYTVVPELPPSASVRAKYVAWRLRRGEAKRIRKQRKIARKQARRDALKRRLTWIRNKLFPVKEQPLPHEEPTPQATTEETSSFGVIE